LLHIGPSAEQLSAHDEDHDEASDADEPAVVKSDAPDGLLSDVVSAGLNGLYHASSALLGQSDLQGCLRRDCEGAATGFDGGWVARPLLSMLNNGERPNCAPAGKGNGSTASSSSTLAARGPSQPKRAKNKAGKTGGAKAST